MKLSLMITCLGDMFRPAAGEATVKLLKRLGHTLDFPRAQTCCGQPMFNSGYSDQAREVARHTIEIFEKCETIVVPSGSCAAMVKKEYPHLFEHDAVWGPRAAALASKTFELTDFLVNRLQVTDVGAKFNGQVACHFACHLRLLGQQHELPTLVSHVSGAKVVPLYHEDQCCGFGGSFAVRYPQVSGNMVDDKMRAILQSQADIVVSTDTGCLMNIGGRLHREGHPVEVLHIAELLDRR